MREREVCVREGECGRGDREEGVKEKKGRERWGKREKKRKWEREREREREKEHNFQMRRDR